MIKFIINQYWGVEKLHTQLTLTPTYKVIRPENKCAQTRQKGLTQVHSRFKMRGRENGR